MAIRSGMKLAAAVPALAVGLAIWGAPAAGLSAEPASAACEHADGLPEEITRKQSRDAVVCLINAQRAAHGKSRLEVKSSLRKTAGRHSRRMARRGCFSHECPGERDFVARIFGTSYLPCNCSWGVGEIIAWGGRGLGTPLRIVKTWMGSAKHRTNILDGDFKHVGVGVAWGAPPNPGAQAGTYTADFGYKR